MISQELEYQNGVQLATCQMRLRLVSALLADARRALDIAQASERAVIARAEQAERLLRIESARYTAVLSKLDTARAKLAQIGEVNHSSAQNPTAGQPAASSAPLRTIVPEVHKPRDIGGMCE